MNSQILQKQWVISYYILSLAYFSICDESKDKRQWGNPQRKKLKHTGNFKGVNWREEYCRNFALNSHHSKKRFLELSRALYSLHNLKVNTELLSEYFREFWNFVLLFTLTGIDLRNECKLWCNNVKYWILIVQIIFETFQQLPTVNTNYLICKYERSVDLKCKQ